MKAVNYKRLLEASFLFERTQLCCYFIEKKSNS